MLFLPLALGVLVLLIFWHLQQGLWSDPEERGRALVRRRLFGLLKMAFLLGGSLWLVHRFRTDVLPVYALGVGLGALAIALNEVREAGRLHHRVPRIVAFASVVAPLVLLDPFPWPDRSFGGAIAGGLLAHAFVMALHITIDDMPTKVRWPIFFYSAIAVIIAAFFSWWAVGLVTLLLFVVLAPLWLFAFTG